MLSKLGFQASAGPGLVFLEPTGSEFGLKEENYWHGKRLLQIAQIRADRIGMLGSMTSTLRRSFWFASVLPILALLTSCCIVPRNEVELEDGSRLRLASVSVGTSNVFYSGPTLALMVDRLHLREPLAAVGLHIDRPDESTVSGRSNIVCFWFVKSKSASPSNLLPEYVATCETEDGQTLEGSVLDFGVNKSPLRNTKPIVFAAAFTNLPRTNLITLSISCRTPTNVTRIAQFTTRNPIAGTQFGN